MGHIPHPIWIVKWTQVLKDFMKIPARKSMLLPWHDYTLRWQYYGNSVPCTIHHVRRNFQAIFTMFHNMHSAIYLTMAISVTAPSVLAVHGSRRSGGDHINPSTKSRNKFSMYKSRKVVITFTLSNRGCFHLPTDTVQT